MFKDKGRSLDLYMEGKITAKKCFGGEYKIQEVKWSKINTGKRTGFAILQGEFN